MTARVDELVPTRNRPVELATTLAGLAAQRDVTFRVVVSDQSDAEASFDTPAARSMLRLIGNAEAMRHVPRRGLAEHRAALLSRADAPYVLCLDDDVWLEPGALARLVAAIDELGCGFVGAAVQGLSYVDDFRPDEMVPFERWPGRPEPELVRQGTTGMGATDAAQRGQRHAPGAHARQRRAVGGVQGGVGRRLRAV